MENWSFGTLALAAKNGDGWDSLSIAFAVTDLEDFVDALLR